MMTAIIEEYTEIDPHQYLPLVKSIVDRLDVSLPNTWDKDDMIGYGILGLLEAIERFQPLRGIQFATYASKRIRGAIIDALRKDSPLSRNCWQKVQQITKAADYISARTGKEASLEEIACECNLEKGEVEEAMQSFKVMASVSLEQTLGVKEMQVKDTLKDQLEKSPEAKVLDDEQIDVLGEAISTLEERQRLILTLYYYEELSLKEIAATLDISVSRVSQIKTSALSALRDRLSATYG